MTDKIFQAYQISDEVIRLVENSREFCFLVSPFFKPWPKMAKTLENCGTQKKNIVFILNADEESRLDLKYLNSSYGFDLLYVKNLHSKLFISEQTAILSSMSLYESQHETNVELGYRIDSRRDIREIVESIIQDDILRNPPASAYKGRFYDSIEHLYKEPTMSFSSPVQNQVVIDERDLRQQAANSHAFCIRCKKTIPQSVYRTFCQECFEKWESEESADGKGSYCHLCGKEADVSKTKALCYDCYNNLGVW